MNLIRDVNMVEFWTARRTTERNHEALEKGKKVKNPLALESNEVSTLAELNKKMTLTTEELIIKQKLTIKEAIYNGVNCGVYLREIDFVVPLEGQVKTWTRSFGYALSPKPNTIWIDRRDGWQYEDPNSPPPSNTVFSVLW